MDLTNMDAYIYQSQILKQIAAVDGRVSKTNRNSTVVG
jgi:hypothetical protein